MIEIERPLTCPGAFFENDERSHESQATLLLALGSLLRPEWSTSFKSDWDEVCEDTEMMEIFGDFPLPLIEPLKPGTRFYGDEVGEYIVKSDNTLSTETLAELLYHYNHAYEYNHLIAGAMLVLSLFHKSPLVRVASAVSVIDTFDPRERGTLLDILFHTQLIRFKNAPSTSKEFNTNVYHLALDELTSAARLSDNFEITEIANTALSRLGAPHEDDKSSDGLSKLGPEHASKAKIRALVIHGTIPPSLSTKVVLDQWWSPFITGNLYEHVKNNVPRKDIYGEDDTFDWEGNYNAATREIAARNLRLWLEQQNNFWFDVAAHSHGNNLVFRALHQGATVRNILALSCPVHKKWLPNKNGYDTMESVRVRLDRTILADRARQKFPNNFGIKETYVGWFNHSRSHEPRIWKKYNIENLFQS